MSPARDLSAPLDVRGRVEVVTAGGAVVLEGQGDRVVLDAQSVGAVKSLIEPFRSLFGGPARGGPPREKPRPAEITGRIREVLVVLELTVELRLSGQPVLRIGPAARPSMLARMFGAGPVEIVSAAAVTRVINELRG